MKFLIPRHNERRTRVTLLQTTVSSPLGPLLAVADEEGLCLLEFTDRIRLDTQLKTLARHNGAEPTHGTNHHLERVQQELEAYFAGRLFAFGGPLAVPGTAFQLRVWSALQEIPFGATRSYAELARAIGSPAAARAVGHANGQNRLAIVIPCHRVIARDGTLGGYAGGLDRKRFLLDHERGFAAGRLAFPESA